MTINTTKTTEEILNALEWEQVGTSEDTLTRILTDSAILHAEPLDYPLTDGIFLYIVDQNGKARIIEISIDDNFIDDPNNFSGIPLVIRLSSPLDPV